MEGRGSQHLGSLIQFLLIRVAEIWGFFNGMFLFGCEVLVVLAATGNAESSASFVLTCVVQSIGQRS